MKVQLEIKEKNNKRKIIYILVLAICLLSILISAYVVVFKNEDIAKKVAHTVISDEEYLRKELNFENIFTNETVNLLNKNILITNKINADDDIVGIAYESNEKQAGKYSLNVKVPYININTSDIKQYNSKMEEVFKKKALDIISDFESKDIIYTVDYIAYINQNNILSIAIRSVLKEGNSAQRTIIQTYNYDLQKRKIVTLEEIIKDKGLSIKEIQNKVSNKIKQEQEKVEELKNLGYQIFERDVKNDMYKVENTTEFFLGEDNLLYLVYAYGNENYTSELDLVIF